MTSVAAASRTGRRRLAAVLLLALGLAVVGAGTGRAEDRVLMRAGVVTGWEFQTGRFNDPAGQFPCTAQVQAFAVELGISGVQRIRAHFEVYGPYAPFWLPSERSSSQVAYPAQHGGEFPDDFRNYHVKILLPWGLWFEENGDQLVLDYVGERPSFWKPDLHEEVLVGRFDCGFDELPTCMQGNWELSCAEEVRPDDVDGRGGANDIVDLDQDGIDDRQDPSVGCPPGAVPGPPDPVTGRVVCTAPAGG